MSDYRSAAVQYLRDVIDKTGKTASELAELVGVSHTTFTRPLKNPDYKYAPKFPKLQLLAARTGVPLPDGLAEAPAARDVRLVPKFLEVRYRVRAGHWFELDAEEPPEQVARAVTPDPEYAEFPQWLELVEGDSFDLEIRPGHYAHVVDAREMGYEPKTGDWVIVERHRDQGAIRERTIKEVVVDHKGRVALWPRSSNPKWQEPINLDDGARSGEEVEAFIVGLVLGSYSPRRR
jgi:hypothetical protein